METNTNNALYSHVRKKQSTRIYINPVDHYQATKSYETFWVQINCVKTAKCGQCISEIWTNNIFYFYNHKKFQNTEGYEKYMLVIVLLLWNPINMKDGRCYKINKY